MRASPAIHVVVSGAPASGKTTVAGLLAAELNVPLLDLDEIKEALADVLGAGTEEQSNELGDAAAEVIFRLAPTFPEVIVEGWWRRERRERAIAVFGGWDEVFCTCDPDLAEQRARKRVAMGRHAIHRDVINPAVLEGVSSTVIAAQPLNLGGKLISVDTALPVDISKIADVLGGRS